MKKTKQDLLSIPETTNPETHKAISIEALENQNRLCKNDKELNIRFSFITKNVSLELGKKEQKGREV